MNRILKTTIWITASIVSIVILISLFPQSISYQMNSTNKEQQNTYSFNEPNEQHTVPNYLTELSGLSFQREDKLLCIQDESAWIYEYDLHKKKIDRKYDFKKNGDFEGVTLVKNTAWLLNSSGDLYRIKDFKKKDFKMKKFNTPLNSANDCEGLTYDPNTHSLLIACKGAANLSEEGNISGNKAIYRFDLTEKKLIKDPYILIDLSKIVDYENLGWYDRISHKITSAIEKNGDIRFQPSGIAVHPNTGNLFVIASVGSMVLELDRNGQILHAAHLDRSLHIQPEGICFDNQACLFIANEGRGGSAKIFKFKPES